MRIDDEDETDLTPKLRHMSRESRHTLAACIVLLAFFGLVAVFGNNLIQSIGFTGKSARTGTPSTLAARGNSSASGGMSESDDDLRTGSILYVPDHGNVCRKRVIDNTTWRVREAGTVVCDEAVSWNANSAGNGNSPLARIEAIRGGFKK
jgi:hypothetical protein